MKQINIIEHLPTGSPISRGALEYLTGCTDRQNRRLIHTAREQANCLEEYPVYAACGGYMLPATIEQLDYFLALESHRISAESKPLHNGLKIKRGMLEVAYG